MMVGAVLIGIGLGLLGIMLGLMFYRLVDHYGWHGFYIDDMGAP